MQINTKAKDLEITPAIKEYIEEKIGSVEKFLTRLENQEEAEADVEISRNTKHHHQGKVYDAKVNLHIKGGTLRAEYGDEDVRAAIDKIKDILKIEIEKFKSKK